MLVAYIEISIEERERNAGAIHKRKQSLKVNLDEDLD